MCQFKYVRYVSIIVPVPFDWIDRPRESILKAQIPSILTQDICSNMIL